MTAQEVFDQAARHLMAQGKTCGVQYGGCYYRGPVGTEFEGMKCAVGALLEDSEYQPWFESKGVGGIPLPARLEPHTNLLRELQSTHDQIAPHFWPEELRRVAERHGLNSEVVG